MRPKYICEMQEGKVVLVDIENRREERKSIYITLIIVTVWMMAFGVILWFGSVHK